MKILPSEVKIHGGCCSNLILDRDEVYIKFTTAHPIESINRMYLRLTGSRLRHFTEIKFREKSLYAVIPEHDVDEQVEAVVVVFQADLSNSSHEDGSKESQEISAPATLTYLEDYLNDVSLRLIDSFSSVGSLIAIIREYVEINDQVMLKNNNVVESVDRKLCCLLYQKTSILDRGTTIQEYMQRNEQDKSIANAEAELLEYLNSCNLMFLMAFFKKLFGISTNWDSLLSKVDSKTLFSNILFTRSASNVNKNSSYSYLVREYSLGEVSISYAIKDPQFSHDEKCYKILSNVYSERITASEEVISANNSHPHITRSESKALLYDGTGNVISEESELSDIDPSVSSGDCLTIPSPQPVSQHSDFLVVPQLTKTKSVTVSDDNLLTVSRRKSSSMREPASSSVTRIGSHLNICEDSQKSPNPLTRAISILSKDEVSKGYLHHIDLNLHRISNVRQRTEVLPEKPKKEGIIQRFKLAMTRRKGKESASQEKPSKASKRFLSKRWGIRMRIPSIASEFNLKNSVSSMSIFSDKSKSPAVFPSLDNDENLNVPWHELISDDFLKTLSHKERTQQEIFHELYLLERGHEIMLKVLQASIYDYLKKSVIIPITQLDELLPELPALRMLSCCMFATMTSFRNSSGNNYIKNIGRCMQEMFPVIHFDVFVNAYTKINVKRQNARKLYEKLIKQNPKFRELIRLNEQNEILKKYVIPDCNDNIASRPFRFYLILTRLVDQFPADTEDFKLVSDVKSRVERIIATINMKVGEHFDADKLKETINKMDSKDGLVSNKFYKYKMSSVFPENIKLIHSCELLLKLKDREYKCSSILLETHLIFHQEANGKLQLFSLDKEPPIIPIYRITVIELPEKAHPRKFRIQCSDFSSTPLIESLDHLANKQLKQHLLEMAPNVKPVYEFDLVNSSTKLTDQVRSNCEAFFSFLLEFHKSQINLKNHCSIVKNQFPEIEIPDSVSRTPQLPRFSATCLKIPDINHHPGLQPNPSVAFIVLEVSEAFEKCKIDVANYVKFLDKLNDLAKSLTKSHSGNEDSSAKLNLFMNSIMTALTALEKFHTFYNANISSQNNTKNNFLHSFIPASLETLSNILLEPLS